MNFESLIYPPCDAPLMEAYGGRFESLYVVLHPFVQVPAELAWQTTKQYPSDEQIRAHATKCGWSYIAAQTGLDTFARVNHALLTTIRSLKDEFCDFAAAQALNTFLQAEPIWMPGEGVFEPLLEVDFLAAFAAAGHSDLVFVPEFPQADPMQTLSVADLNGRTVPFPHRGSLVAPDGSFLFTVDWDSFFTLFYGPLGFVEEVVRRQQLEGFFANPRTEHAWFNFAFGCSVVTVTPEG